MSLRLCIWWVLFVPVSIYMQAALPSVDVLVIGLIITLQEERYKDLIFALPILIIIQEGIGSREFGGAILWYSIVIILFFWGRWLFEVQNTHFVMLLSICLGVAHFLLVFLLAPLQNLEVNMHQLVTENALQIVFMPFAWWLTSFTRKWIYVNVK